MATEKIDISLYDGSVNIVFYPNSHQYKKDGVNLLSVSTVCGVVDKSGPLMYWAVNLMKEYLLELASNGHAITDTDIIEASGLHKKRKEEAGDIGTQAHDWVEQFIKTGALSLPSDPKVMNAINGYLEWKKGKKIEYIHSEIFVYSKKYDYVGIADCIAVVDGKKYLIDFKTSNAIRVLEYGMQTSAYLKAYEEQTGEKLDGIIIIRFSKEEFDKKGNPLDPFEALEIVDIEGFYKAFLSAKVLKEYVKKYDTY